MNSEFSDVSQIPEGASQGFKVTGDTMILRAKSDSSVKKLKAAIIATVHMQHKYKKIEIRAIGASSLNQAIKAFIVAKTILCANGKRLLLEPYFDDIGEGDEERTVICLRIIIE